MSEPAATRLPAIIPLGVLEAVRAVDALTPDGLPEFHEEFVAKRLGLSNTVATQIERYETLADRGTGVDVTEVVAILRLVGRRNDAGVVFTDGGRRAAAYASLQVLAPLRWVLGALPALIRNRFGLAVARRVLARAFGIRLSREANNIAAETTQGTAVEATPDGTACKFFGSAIAAVLRTFTSFDGAVVHEQCRSRGDTDCLWRTATTAKE